MFNGVKAHRNNHKHNLGYWVETREDALQESYYLYHWYKGQEKAAWKILINLAKTLDEAKEEDYVDPEYTGK